MILADLAVLAIVLGFLVILFGRKRKEKRAALWVNVLLFTGFIALNVASASVTIRVELRQQRALGREDVVISPGNYGLDFLKTPITMIWIKV